MHEKGWTKEENTLCSKKSDAKIQITITTAYLTRIKYPLSGFNYHPSDVREYSILTRYAVVIVI